MLLGLIFLLLVGAGAGLLTHGWQKDEAQRMAEQPAIESPESTSDKTRVPLNELALFFLRLGTTAFGGPAAHIAIMINVIWRRAGRIRTSPIGFNRIVFT
jgi:hypothetical protein